MGKKKASCEGDLHRCGNLDCDVAGRDKVGKKCARCLAVRYCSEECQRQHWRRSGGNHRAHCKPAPKLGEAADIRVPASASLRGPRSAATAGGEHDADDPEHSCPICLVNEDDHGKCGMCFACGQLYCGECNGAAGVENCPTCRAPFAVAAGVAVERLLRLVGRSPGHSNS